MKFNTSRLLLFATLFFSVFSIRNIKSNSNQDDILKIFSELFTDPVGSKCKDIPVNPMINPAANNNIVTDDNGVTWNGPRKKINILDKQQGQGDSAYLFDYIDELFQADVTKEFKRIYDEVKALKPDEKEFTEPYPLSKLVGLYSQNTKTEPASDPNDPALISKLKSILGQNQNSFDEKAYIAGITVGNIYKACKDFQWNYNPQEVNFAKRIVDTYDFDGDGRLNPREFIIMTIDNNRNILGTTCKNCYNDLISKKIDPIFRYIDCNNDGKINAEEMFEHLMSLKKKTNNYNIYNCKIKGKYYRTSSMNDIIIKNFRNFYGYLTKEEFRAAILLGYWDRQTSSDQILLDDSRNFKKLRWDSTGATDYVCQRIINHNSPASTQSKSTPTPTIIVSPKRLYK